MTCINVGIVSNSCLNFLNEHVLQSTAMVEQMALQPSPIYHKMQSMFEKYEAGQLKGQKQREMKGLNLQKALEGRFAPKLPQFKLFQGLKVCI